MIALVLLAGVAGALVRFIVVRSLHAPWAVLAVNVAGSLLGGLLLASTSGEVRLIVLTGFCGGLTTFSTLSVETIQFALEGKFRVAVLGVLGNLTLGIGAAFAGYAIGSLLN